MIGMHGTLCRFACVTCATYNHTNDVDVPCAAVSADLAIERYLFGDISTEEECRPLETRNPHDRVIRRKEQPR